MSTDFSRIQRQGKWIASAYKAIGLYSIPLLTTVTIVSMTNVFTAGTFAQWPYVSTAWAFIFAFAIDVNIVRLFVEAAIDKSKAAFAIGLGLCIVTGAALFIEGLQQSIGIAWSNQYVHFAITILVACRVILVIVLMAREGSKLGASLVRMADAKPPIQDAISEPETAYDTEPITEAVSEEITGDIPQVKAEWIEAFNRYPKLQAWYSTGRRSASINEVIEVTGFSQKMISNRMKDGTLKTPGRNPKLVLKTSVIDWLTSIPAPALPGLKMVS